MKKIILIVLFFNSWVTINAQGLIAVQNGGTPSFYEDLSEAIQSASAGDTLYLPGKNFVVNDTIRKELHFVGVGHNPNSTQATGSTIFSSSIIIRAQIVLDSGASNGSITGVKFTSNYYNGTSHPTLITINDVENYLIDRCFFGSSVNGTFSNSVIKESIFVGSTSVFSNRTSLISNNIFVVGGNVFEKCAIKNNIFLFSSSNYRTITAKYCTIDNNIFELGNAHTRYSYNSNFRNNLNAGNNSSYGSGNYLSSTNLVDIFVAYTGLGDVASYTADFHLPENSPYKNGGIDGTDIGIYGGIFPWKENSIPFTPHIVTKNVSSSTDTDGKIHIEIQIKAQEN